MRKLAIVFLMLASVSALAADVDYRTFDRADATTKALVQRAVDGLGGANAVRGLQSLRNVATMKETSKRGVSQTQVDGIVVLPDIMYARVKSPTGGLTAVLRPDVAFAYLASSVIKSAAVRLSETEKNTVRLYFYEEPLFVLHHQFRPSNLFASGPTRVVNGMNTQTLYVLANDIEEEWSIDETSGHVVRVTIGDMTTDLGDWRQVSGLWLPYSAKRTQGDLVTTVQYSLYEVNPQIDPASIPRTPTTWALRDTPQGPGYFDWTIGHENDPDWIYTAMMRLYESERPYANHRQDNRTMENMYQEMERSKYQDHN